VKLRAELAERLERRFVAEALRLQHAKPALESRALDRRREQLAAAPLFPIRLGDHRQQLVSGLGQRMQRRQREAGRCP
jgi:hypothetical protein